jgi:hypothetical protein
MTTIALHERPQRTWNDESVSFLGYRRVAITRRPLHHWDIVECANVAGRKLGCK